MPTAIPAGVAAPTPAAVELRLHTLGFVNAPEIVVASSVFGEPTVLLATGIGSVPRALTPTEARLLAVYLVDCANALDNPAARVIDDTDGVAVDSGPWSVAMVDGKPELFSDDFEHDVKLRISGDFADDQQRMNYANALAAQLNAASGVTVGDHQTFCASDAGEGIGHE